jgi:hypothetical protein
MAVVAHCKNEERGERREVNHKNALLSLLFSMLLSLID